MSFLRIAQSSAILLECNWRILRFFEMATFCHFLHGNHMGNTSIKDDDKDNYIFQTCNNGLFVIHIGHSICILVVQYGFIKALLLVKVLYIASKIAKVFLLRLLVHELDCLILSVKTAFLNNGIFIDFWLEIIKTYYFLVVCNFFNIKFCKYMEKYNNYDCIQLVNY